MANHKNTYDVKTQQGDLIGKVKAKDLHCAAIQARRKFWPKGASAFAFSISINREPGGQP